MNRDIANAVSVFRTSPSLGEDEIYRALVKDGMERHRAARLVEFLPMVYCRLILQKSGAQFPTTFRRTLPDGTSSEHPMSSDPVWNDAVAFARAEVESGVSGQDLLIVAAHSAEFDAANQLLNRGSKLEDIRFTVPVFRWPESGPDIDVTVGR